MATNTSNYGFKKPDESDFYDVADQNKNWDLADKILKNLDTPTFEDYTGSTAVPSATDAIDQIKSKGKLGALLANIKAAFKGACLIGHIVNNCVTDNAGLPLSAAQGKVLMDKYTQLYSEMNARVETYTPQLAWDNGMPIPALNMECRKTICGHICFLYARYEIENISAPSKTSLTITLPHESIVKGPYCIGHYYASRDSTLLIRPYEKKALVVNGIGGDYSSEIIKVGYQGFSMMYMF